MSIKSRSINVVTNKYVPPTPPTPSKPQKVLIDTPSNILVGTNGRQEENGIPRGLIWKVNMSDKLKKALKLPDPWQGVSDAYNNGGDEELTHRYYVKYDKVLKQAHVLNEIHIYWADDPSDSNWEEGHYTTERKWTINNIEIYSDWSSSVD